MLKWILIGLGVLVLAVAGTCYWGYRQITAGGNTAAVMVATTTERAWGWLSNADSLATLSDSVTTFRSSGGIEIAVGDTLFSDPSRPGGAGEAGMAWVVSRLEAPRVRVLTAYQDTLKTPMLQRIDSVVAVGDSVRVSSTITAPFVAEKAESDSLRGLGGTVMRGTANMMRGALRLVVQNELDRLKVRLERP